MRNEIAARVKALRLRLKMTSDEVAIASKKLDRTEVSKVENGKNQGKSDRIRGALAVAFGVDRVLFGEYLDSRISIDTLLAKSAAPGASATLGSAMHDHPRWAAIADALVKKWGFSPDFVAQTGRMQWAWDIPIESADEHTVLQIIRAVDDAGKRAALAAS